jgi:polyhydroxyalkanoate synthesis regulator phasin
MSEESRPEAGAGSGTGSTSSGSGSSSGPGSSSGSGSAGIGEGIRTGLGILNAFRETVEETFREAVDRGDLTPDRAREVMRNTVSRVQETLVDARERVDYASRREVDELRAKVEALEARLARLEGGGSAGPEETTPGGIILSE